MGRGRRGAIAAITVTAILMASLILSLAIAAYMGGRGGVKQAVAADILEAPRTPEIITAYLYNVSLCALLEGEVVERPWRMVVQNTGNREAVIDYFAWTLGDKLLYEAQPGWRLRPGEYVKIPGANGRMESSGLEQLVEEMEAFIHTERGGSFNVKVYRTPPPEALVRVRGGACVEP